MTKKIERISHQVGEPLFLCFTHHKKDDVDCECCAIEESCIIRKQGY